jgi:cell division protein FtsB
MTLRRRPQWNFASLLVPLICCAGIAYFGYNGIFGPRGVLAWNNSSVELAVERKELAQVRGEREALQHRITLLQNDAIDPDLLEEVAHNLLSEGRTGEVAVPREKIEKQR